jgi:hypothetical protein
MQYIEILKTVSQHISNETGIDYDELYKKLKERDEKYLYGDDSFSSVALSTNNEFIKNEWDNLILKNPPPNLKEIKNLVFQVQPKGANRKNIHVAVGLQDLKAPKHKKGYKSIIAFNPRVKNLCAKFNWIISTPVNDLCEKKEEKKELDEETLLEILKKKTKYLPRNKINLDDITEEEFENEEDELFIDD